MYTYLCLVVLSSYTDSDSMSSSYTYVWLSCHKSHKTGEYPRDAQRDNNKQASSIKKKEISNKETSQVPIRRSLCIWYLILVLKSKQRLKSVLQYLHGLQK